MVDIGYALSSEELKPHEMVEYAQRAEDAGFKYLMISDHYHPWIDAQGESPFAWTMIGALLQATGLPLGTAVTCPTFRYHPALVAQMAATAQALANGRFILGIGTGEYLNEHIYGDYWPPYDVRNDMLEEAVSIMRTLWEGDQTTMYGEYYTVEEARIYTLPDSPPPIVVAAGGPSSAKLAANIGDGLMSTSPDADLLKTYRENGGQGSPTYGQATVSYAETDEEAVEIAYKQWPTGAVPGQLHQELRMPALFEDAVQLVSKDDVASRLVCSSDPQKHIEDIQKYVDAGFSHVHIHAVGPHQKAFIDMYEKEVLPAFS